MKVCNPKIEETYETGIKPLAYAFMPLASSAVLLGLFRIGWIF